MDPNTDSPSQIDQLDVLILMQMATLNAVGAHSITEFELKQRLPDVDFDQITGQIMRLTKRMLVARTVRSGQVRVSLTDLGAAIARELKGVRLDNLSEK
jgi:hypothetical protein